MDKRGLSELMAYVMLISITMALAVLVYGWLRFYVDVDEQTTCPENVAVLIQEYSCAGKKLSLTLENKGYFNVDGFILRVDNKQDSERGIFNLDNIGTYLGVGNSTTQEYDYSTYDSLTYAEVQPFILTKKGKVLCSQTAKQPLSGC